MIPEQALMHEMADNRELVKDLKTQLAIAVEALIDIQYSNEEYDKSARAKRAIARIKLKPEAVVEGKADKSSMGEWRFCLHGNASDHRGTMIVWPKDD